MTPYFTVFVILVLLSIFELAEVNIKYRFWAAITAAVLILLFAGLRTPETSNDGISYVSVFLDVPDLFTWLGGGYKYSYDILQMEPLYILLGSAIRLFTENYVWLFLIVAALAVSFNTYNYFKYSPYVILTLILYYSHTFLYREMGQIRAGLACAIALFSIDYIYRKKPLKFSGVMAAASLVHFAAVPFVLSYFVNLVDFKKRTLYIILGVSIIAGLITLTPLLIQSLPDSDGISRKIITYYESDRYGSALGILDITNIKLLLFSVLLIYFKDKLQSRFPFYKTMLYIYLIGTVWRIIFSDFSIFAARIATFFTIVEVILLPLLITAFSYKRLAYAALLVYAFGSLYLNLYIKEAVNIYGMSVDIMQLFKI